MKVKINIQLLEEKIKLCGSKKQFCKNCKISPQTLNRLLKNNTHVSIPPVYRILITFDLSFYDLIVFE